jgi:hypothetical protein
MRNAFHTDPEDEGSARGAAQFERVYDDSGPVVGTESAARGTILLAFREAVLERYGSQGLADVAQRLPRDVRAATLDNLLLDVTWMPETHVLAWYDALWKGPCEGSSDNFCTLLDAMLNLGFGRVRRAFLKLASPETILARAPGLWRYDHSHGRLIAEVGSGVARVRLEDHIYTSTPLSCLAISEIYRYCASLTRVRHVSESHFRNGSGTLTVTLRWKV